ncbi:hypothetical protein CPB83DRAFT_859028 [Crepidotus variabilis]|uniref:Uncharacterized protein n=1 Tax=Crepidotus variabilis TaxID=179855 RepID=A0A9P6EAY8_9AGAR|nr:hypothetical protein CPB83DRAFT_859028 [Crepidotus variabilis]
MIPFGVKILWFILTLIGLFGSWVVLWAFGRVVGARWGPLAFCIGNTIVQVTLCLGMIYHMNPLAMPSSFCIAQKLLVSIGTYLMSATVLVFSLATITAVLKPKTWDNATRALQWRNAYIFPLVLVPLSGTLLYAGLLVKFKPTPHDGMMCDGASPNWVNLLSPSSIPFVLCAPIVLYQSVLAIKSINKTKLHLFRSRPESGVERVSESSHRKSLSGGVFQYADERRPRGMFLTLPLKLGRKNSKDKRPQVVTLELEHIGGDVRHKDIANEKVDDQSRVSGHGGVNVRRIFCIPIASRSAKSGKVAEPAYPYPEPTTPNLDTKSPVSPTASPSTPNPNDPEEYTKVAAALTGEYPIRYSTAGRTSSRFSIPDGELDVDDISSRVSSSFPVFSNDDALSCKPPIVNRRRPTQEIVLEEEEHVEAQSQQFQKPLHHQAPAKQGAGFDNVDPDATISNVDLVPRNSSSLQDGSLDGSFHTATENRRTPHQVYGDDTDGETPSANTQDDWTHVEVDRGSAMGSVLEFRTPGMASKLVLDQLDTTSSGRSGQAVKDMQALNQPEESIDLEDGRYTRRHPTNHHKHSKTMSSNTKRTPTSMNFSAISGPFKRRREHARLSPAIYTLIIFQFYFTCVQLVAFCSPLRHSVGGNSVSAPYASHFVAMLLAEWGAIVIFGMLPCVRRNLVPWHPVARPVLPVP